MAILGVQIIADLYECEAGILDDPDRIRDAMLEASRRAGATIIGEHFHRFSPQGVSGMVIIAESHLAIHTWPEHRYAALDLFTCGHTLQSGPCFDYLVEVLGCQRPVLSTLERGQALHATVPAAPVRG